MTSLKSIIYTPTLETTLGFLGLVCYILTLLPTILRIVISLGDELLGPPGTLPT